MNIITEIIKRVLVSIPAVVVMVAVVWFLVSLWSPVACAQGAPEIAGKGVITPDPLTVLCHEGQQWHPLSDEHGQACACLPTEPDEWITARIQVSEDRGYSEIITEEAMDRADASNKASRIGVFIDTLTWEDTMLFSACESIVKCAKAVDETCKIVGSGKAKKVHLSDDGCEGQCQDGRKVVIICVRPDPEPRWFVAPPMDDVGD